MEAQRDRLVKNQPNICGKIVSDSEVDLSLPEASDQSAGVVDLDVEVDARMLLVKLIEGGGHDVAGQALIDANDNMSPLKALYRRNLIVCDAQLIVSRAKPCAKNVSRLCQLKSHATTLAIKKRRAEVDLQIGYLTIDRRCRNAQ
jgi:hypothetical protein